MFSQLLPGLFQWQSDRPGPHHPVSSYLWSGDQGLVVVDPAADFTQTALDSAGMGRVTDIVITHLQRENAEGSRHFPEARIHVPAGDEYLCRGARTYEKSWRPWPPPWDWETRGNFQGNVAGARNERPLPTPLKLAEPMHPGRPICRAEVLSTPGHGKNAVTILLVIDGKRVAFCGDLIFGDGQLWNWFDAEWDYGIETGQHRLLQSLRDLRAAVPDILCPTHGPAIHEPLIAIDTLCRRLENVFDSASPSNEVTPCLVPSVPDPGTGFRSLNSSLHQYVRNSGNCNVLVSKTGKALLVDDGLCAWLPLPARAAHHHGVIARMKRALDIQRIEVIIPTHYHGDHIENIPALVESEGSQVMCLDFIADVIENPGRFNLACALPWYGTGQKSIAIDRRFQSGDSFHWHEFELEIFHLGGQTHYHLGIALNVETERVLFVGDSIDFEGGLTPPVLCYNKANPDSSGWLYAIERMIERQPDLLVCGHGIAIRNPMDFLLRSREAWGEKMQGFRRLSARKDLRYFFDPFFEIAETE